MNEENYTMHKDKKNISGTESKNSIFKLIRLHVGLSAVFTSFLVTINPALALPKPYLGTPVLITGSTKIVSGVSADIVVYNLNYDGKKLTGFVLNRGKKLLNYAKVKYAVLDARGYSLGIETVYLNETALRARQTGIFATETQTRGSHILIQSVEWLDNVSGLGPCNIPGQTAANGSQCGGRAASERSGGRL